MTISDWARNLRHTFPPAAALEVDVPKSDELKHFAYLWMLEGVPFAFQDYPFVFQKARDTFARQFALPARDVTLVGSARNGYSIRADQFGRAYDPNRSDIDLIVVATALYDRLRTEATKWIEDFEAGRSVPRSDFERDLWASNVQVLSKNFGNRFIDTNKVPNRYPLFGQLNKAADTFAANLNSWAAANLARKVTLRVYRDWEACSKRVALTVENNIRKLAKERGAI